MNSFAFIWRKIYSMNGLYQFERTRGVYLNGWGCTGVRETILGQEIYCAKTNPKPGTQYGSRVGKELGTQATQSIQEYDLATTILIWMLTQALTCKIGSSIFLPWVDSN